MARRQPVSIVCVYNDPDVLRDCLSASVEALLSTAPETELISVDNTGHRFTTAGEALGHGASRARHGVIAFVHQDVILHSLVALEEAAGSLVDDPSIGMAGCCGIDRSGVIKGRIRDRVVLIGDPATSPTEVDSLDEVLFLLRAQDVRDQPLARLPELAWHAYAVEYGLRVRAGGRSVVALDVPVTHNSLTINLDRLDVAHATVGRLYPTALPVRTTCGVVAPPPGRPGPVSRALLPHRWRYRWLRESVMVHRGARRSGLKAFVLGDIRLDVDEILARVGSLSVVNVDDGSFDRGQRRELAATRRGYPVQLLAVPFEAASDRLGGVSADTSVLVTNLTLEHLAHLPEGVVRLPHLLGYATDLGYWLLLGPAAEQRASSWDERRARPAVASALGV